MNPGGQASLWLIVVCSAMTVAGLLLVAGARSVIPYVGAYFLVFGLGPAAVYLTGGTIYIGIATIEIPKAMLGILLALVGMLIGTLVVRSRPPSEQRVPSTEGRHFPMVPIVLAGLSGYAVLIVALHGPAMLGGTKLDKITAAGPGHYSFLLIELFACSLYFLAVRTRNGRITYWVNMACYVTYCLVTDERDFAFVFFALLLHTQLLRRSGNLVRPVLWGLVLLCGATALFDLRAGITAAPSDVLNQGSVLFVDTFVMSHVDAGTPLQYGATYVHAVTNLLPSVFQSHQPTLSQWLVDSYAPGSTSGYGFSLTGEAYLNFGLVGIPVVFGLLTAAHRWISNRFERGQFYAYTSMLFTVAWMYGFRGESASLLKTAIDGLVFYGLIQVTSIRVTPIRVTSIEMKAGHSDASRRHDRGAPRAYAGRRDLDRRQR